MAPLSSGAAVLEPSRDALNPGGVAHLGWAQLIEHPTFWFVDRFGHRLPSLWRSRSACFHALTNSQGLSR
jgi:hypothetical protein